MPRERFSAKDKATAARREARWRAVVYPKRIANRRMTAADAERQIAIMEAIAADYELAAAKEVAANDLFGGNGAA